MSLKELYAGPRGSLQGRYLRDAWVAGPQVSRGAYTSSIVRDASRAALNAQWHTQQ